MDENVCSIANLPQFTLVNILYSYKWIKLYLIRKMVLYDKRVILSAMDMHRGIWTLLAVWTRRPHLLEMLCGSHFAEFSRANSDSGGRRLLHTASSRSPSYSIAAVRMGVAVAHGHSGSADFHYCYSSRVGRPV